MLPSLADHLLIYGKVIVSKQTWDEWFISLAYAVANKSKDPSTKVGALIIRPDRSIVAAGYNGFPRSIEDTEERLNDRPTKYSLIIHAEMNAVLTARENLTGYTLYTVPFMPCDRCFVHMLQAGITRFVYPKATADQESRWGTAFKQVRMLAEEAKVELKEMP
jgi:dCMP deaminase